MGLAKHLLFENPLTLWVVLFTAAAVSAGVWRRTASARARTVAVCSVAAAALAGLLAWAVETDRERVLRSLEQMAQAAATGQAEALIERISAEYGGSTDRREKLAAVVRFGLERVRATAESPGITLEDGRATVRQVYRFAPVPGSNVVLPPEYQRVTWEGVFAPDPDGQWRLRSAVAVHPRRMAPEEAAMNLNRARP